jgi:conjugal transfer pilus assembly protein TraW
MASFLKFSLLITLCICGLEAKDLGTHGQTFPILEKNLLTAIQEQLNLKAEHLAKLNQNMQKQLSEKVKGMREVIGLNKACHPRTFYFDPTVCAQENILDHQNQVIVAKGFCFNPLTTHPLVHDLIFFDATDSQQLEWATKYHVQAQWILTKGQPIQLEADLQRPIYFDQLGILTKKLDITAVPALVSQEGLKLKIEEIYLKEDACVL